MSWKTSIIQPTSDSSPRQWSSYPYVWHYQCVDELFPNEDLDYICTKRDRYQDWFNLTNWGSWITKPLSRLIKIDRFVIVVRAKMSKLSFPSCTISILHNLPDPNMQTNNILTLRYCDYSRTVYSIGTLGNMRKPTISDIDSLQVGVQAGVPKGVKNEVKVTQISVSIYWDYNKTPGFTYVNFTP